VIRLDDGPFLRVERQCAELEAGAGVDLMRLTKACSRRGLSGLEGLAGIPGTVGGAVRMNAGGRYGEMRDVVSRLRILNENGAIDMLNHDEVGFGYRHSDLDGRIVLSARLRLKHDDPKETFARYREFFAIKQRTQPLVEPSAGCIFKNPNGKSAGALIDQAGMKGVSSGQARVSERHANFIVAGRGATSSDVLRLIDLIRERILSLFGIQLETEIDIW
jgi:UDP-N-acetylmuramate dehydrogenase